MNKPPTSKRVSTISIIVVTLAIVLLAILGWIVWSQKNRDNVSGKQTTQQNGQKYATFDGTVTGINNGCAHDDICTISVDGKAIVTGGGLSSNPDANVYGVTDADLAVGDKVSVKALNSDRGLTLQGCKECYITRGEARRQ